ncbi:MAG: Nudix family hydrolase [Pseudomonadota bacterium]
MSLDKQNVHVCVGILKREQQIFIAQRQSKSDFSGFWEFPGGKLEIGETPLQCLRREMSEEVGIDVKSVTPLIQIKHQYTHKKVLLDVYTINDFIGDPIGAEGQHVRWVEQDELHQYQFPDANISIISACQLPSLYRITPNLSTVTEFRELLKKSALQSGDWIQLRCPELPFKDFVALASEILPICRDHQHKLLLNSELKILDYLEVDGLHLSQSNLHKVHGSLKEQSLYTWIGASCHDLQEVRFAEQQGVDFITISPVSITTSHPETIPLGWQSFSELVKETHLPVFALGGVSPKEVYVAKECGAQGVAGISSFW